MRSPLLSFICISLLLGMQSWCVILTSSKRPRLTSSSSSNATVHTLAQNTLKHDNNSISSNITEYETLSYSSGHCYLQFVKPRSDRKYAPEVAKLDLYTKKMARRLIIIRCCGHRSCSPRRVKARKLAIARATNLEVSITCPTCDKGWQTMLNLKSNTLQGIPVKCLQCPADWQSRLDFAKVDLWGDPNVLVIGLKKTKRSTAKVKNVTTTPAETDTTDDTSDTDEMTVTSTMQSITKSKVPTMQTVTVTTKATNTTTARSAASNITTVRTGSTLQILGGVSMTLFKVNVTTTTRRVTTTTEEDTTDYEEGVRKK